MKRSIVVLGIVLLIIGGVGVLGSLNGNFTQYKKFTWKDVSSDAPIIYVDREPHFAYVQITGLEKDRTLKVLVTPAQSDDSILLLLMTPKMYEQYKEATVHESDVLVWQESTDLGQPVSFEYKVPESGEYVLVIHPLKDSDNDGVSFALEWEISQPLDITLPGLLIALAGLILLAFGMIRKPTMRGTPAAELPSSDTTLQPPGRYCINCGESIPESLNYCAKCGSKQSN